MMEQVKKNNRWILRIKTAWQILFVRKHFVVMFMTPEDIVSIDNHDVLYNKKITTYLAGMHRYHVQRLIKTAAESIAEVDIAVGRAVQLAEKEWENESVKNGI